MQSQGLTPLISLIKKNCFEPYCQRSEAQPIFPLHLYRAQNDSRTNKKRVLISDLPPLLPSGSKYFIILTFFVCCMLVFLEVGSTSLCPKLPFGSLLTVKFVLQFILCRHKHGFAMVDTLQLSNQRHQLTPKMPCSPLSCRWRRRILQPLVTCGSHIPYKKSQQRLPANETTRLKITTIL